MTAPEFDNLLKVRIEQASKKKTFMDHCSIYGILGITPYLHRLFMSVVPPLKEMTSLRTEDIRRRIDEFRGMVR